MGTYETKKWLRVNGFDRDHPHPGPDLGYDGRELETGSLKDVDTERYDAYWQDPIEPKAWLIVADRILIEDLEAWA